eukprot:EST43926.1 Hypothetical protein SS50377_16228 [Spironucleus salmonicida]
MQDPVIHIACDRLGVTQNQLNMPSDDKFVNQPNPKVLYFEAVKFVNSVQNHVMLEVAKMRQKGITEAEWNHVGSPQDFPFKIFTNKGKPVDNKKKVVIENRFAHVLQLEQDKINKTQQYLDNRDQNSQNQLMKVKNQQQMQSKYLNMVFNDAIKTAENVINNGEVKRSNLRNSLNGQDQLRQYYMQQDKDHQDNNRQMRSAVHSQKIQTANKIVKGIEQDRQIQRENVKQKQEKYIQERCLQKEKLLEKVVDANMHHSQQVNQHCQSVRLSEKLNSQIKRQKQEQKEFQSSCNIQDMKMSQHAELESTKSLHKQYLEDKYQQFKEMEQVKKDCKVLYFQTKDEVAALNLTGTGAKIVKDRQLVQTVNSVRDQKSQWMRDQIKANIEYKKNIYDTFKDDVPFVM